MLDRTLALTTALILAATTLSPAAQTPVSGSKTLLPVPATPPELLATVRGKAVTANGAVLRNARVRLRDARLGRIVNTELSDQAGAFSFNSLDPGNYVVELVGVNQSPIAATQILSANAGETITAAVRLPLGRPSLIASILSQQGTASTPAGAGLASVADVLTGVVEQLPQAAVQSIPAIVPVGEPVSETRNLR